MVRLLHLPQRDGDTLHDALKARMADLPAALLRSITWDQGTEMARHLTIAKSLGVPPYVVFPDTTLIAFATERPRSRKELLAISGVGQAKLERYGDAFLEIILAHDD